MRQPTTLFNSGNSLIEHLERQRQQAMTEAKKTHDVEDVGETASEIAERHVPQSVHLARAEAEFETRDLTDGQVAVSVVVPFTGERQLLAMTTPGVRLQPNSPAEIEDQLFEYKEDRRYKLVLSKTFDRPVEEDRVRAWARESVNAVERVTEAQRELIGEWSVTLMSTLTSLVSARGAGLNEAETLKKNLGRGI